MKRKAVIATAVIGAIVIFNIIYSVMHLPDEQDFLRYDTQAMYNGDFYKDGRYPDLFLRALVRDKKVIVPRELKTYDDYSSFGRDEEDGNPFDKKYLTENDYIRYFEAFAAETGTDTSLPDMKEVSESLKDYKGSFISLGIANDLLRYSFPLNHDEVQQARGFWYYWYYHHFAEKEPDRPDSFPEVYVDTEGLAEAGTLVALWDEHQDLYLMSEERFRDGGDT